LKSLLQYWDFHNFREVIAKAILPCQNSGYDQKHHFVEVTEMVQIGTGAKMAILDYPNILPALAQPGFAV
jgi:DNA-damage-inducible protein D